jgi:hypothetical protein
MIHIESPAESSGAPNFNLPIRTIHKIEDQDAQYIQHLVCEQNMTHDESAVRL